MKKTIALLGLLQLSQVPILQAALVAEPPTEQKKESWYDWAKSGLDKAGAYIPAVTAAGLGGFQLYNRTVPLWRILPYSSFYNTPLMADTPASSPYGILEAFDRAVINPHGYHFLSLNDQVAQAFERHKIKKMEMDFAKGMGMELLDVLEYDKFVRGLQLLGVAVPLFLIPYLYRQYVAWRAQPPVVQAPIEQPAL